MAYVLALGRRSQLTYQYHDDGESTLGPSIATLSLGGQASMRIRMKASSWNGLVRKKTYKGRVPVAPGCKNEAALHALNAQFDQASAAEWAKLVEEFFCKQKEIKVNAPVVLEMQLNHGDMVVMNGADIQKYYEVCASQDVSAGLTQQHCVIPRGNLRYAMTCRFIKPELIDASQHWKGLIPGNLTEYDGDAAIGHDPTPDIGSTMHPDQGPFTVLDAQHEQQQRTSEQASFSPDVAPLIDQQHHELALAPSLDEMRLDQSAGDDLPRGLGPPGGPVDQECQTLEVMGNGAAYSMSFTNLLNQPVDATFLAGLTKTRESSPLSSVPSDFDVGVV